MHKSANTPHRYTRPHFLLRTKITHKCPKLNRVLAADRVLVTPVVALVIYAG